MKGSDMKKLTLPLLTVFGLLLQLCLVQVAMAAPSAITNLTASVVDDDILLTWTSPNPNGSTNVAYEIRQSTSSTYTEAIWNASPVVHGAPVPTGGAGTPESLRIKGAAKGVYYYFNVKTKDSTGAWSGLSNTVAMVSNGGRSGQLLNYYVQEDAYVQGGSLANTNYGSSTSLITTNPTATPISCTRSYIKFNLAYGPTSFDSVKFRVNAHSWTNGGVPYTVYLYSSATSTWVETTITWNNSPGYGTLLDSVDVRDAAEMDNGKEWYEMDVTSYVNSELAAGRTTISFVTYVPTVSQQGPGITMDSKEAGNPASLVATTKLNTAPTVTITAPTDNSAITANSNLTITASVSDPDAGDTIDRVQFFDDFNLLGEDTTSPYSFTYTSVPAGTHRIVVRAWDNKGAYTDAEASVTSTGGGNLTDNMSPKADLTASATELVTTDSVTLTVDATDEDDTISQVEFFNGSTLVGTVTTQPYEIVLNNMSAGIHDMTAKATDARGATATTMAVQLHVNPVNTTTVTLAPTADAMVMAYGAPDTNFGTNQVMTVLERTGNNTREVYMKFDLTSVASISKARLRLGGHLATYYNLLENFRVYSATNTSWLESTITWNNRPARGTTIHGTFKPFTLDYSTYEADLTSFLQAEKAAGRNVVTLVLGMTPGNSTANFLNMKSKESADDAPVLVITQ
jgi:hypothetical protein